MTGSSTEGIKTVLHPVSDPATAEPVYAALLGVSPRADEPYDVGFEAKPAEVTAAGAIVQEPAHDVGGGRPVAVPT